MFSRLNGMAPPFFRVFVSFQRRCLLLWVRDWETSHNWPLFSRALIYRYIRVIPLRCFDYKQLAVVATLRISEVHLLLTFISLYCSNNLIFR